MSPSPAVCDARAGASAARTEPRAGGATWCQPCPPGRARTPRERRDTRDPPENTVDKTAGRANPTAAHKSKPSLFNFFFFFCTEAASSRSEL